MTLRSITAFLCTLVLLPAIAAAQGPVAPVTTQAMPWIVGDVRVGWPAIGADEITAASIGRRATDLPGRALTGGVGLHAYPLRLGRFTVGVGAEVLRGRGSFQQKDGDGKPVGEPINRALAATAWQASLNFGRGQGWSYLTAGTGPFQFDTYPGDGPGDGEQLDTVNVGGGARWFKWRHAGVTTDVRFYLTKASKGTQVVAPRGARRIVVLSVGLTIK